MPQINLIIFSSENGRSGWQPVQPEDVPEWVKEPENIARLVEGEACMKCDEGEKGSLWYIALPAEDVARLWTEDSANMRRAEEKRARKNAKRLH